MIELTMGFVQESLNIWQKPQLPTLQGNHRLSFSQLLGGQRSQANT